MRHLGVASRFTPPYGFDCIDNWGRRSGRKLALKWQAHVVGTKIIRVNKQVGVRRAREFEVEFAEMLA